ncbi:maleylpyruvate isomerase family mycothiol-dependent enzyme [Actinomycetospora sp. NBRC 106375]|uniref:maleylpyruvate isomerase family mycothiol-dependent enzyme n=1 Tax=Actinomycetospora sp. NBRC 106375 TaxID=3032207 RepID=UPI002555D795|nr:maleylpyruvate isomerase family mycothiol-dependent enzyme [Actinomycetospora sp. NBRC 106375]
MRSAQRRYVTAFLPHVAAERRDLADQLEGLDDAAWATPSLCGSWTAHDVLAHLTFSVEIRSAPLLWEVARARGDIDAVFDRHARERAAAREPAQLLERLRATAAVPHRLGISAPTDPLDDVLVHGQDIARPLGLVRPMPVERVLLVVDAVCATAMYGARRRFAGLRLVATDADWARGEGPEVRGPLGELLLVATGRPAGLDALTGPGVEQLTARMTPAGVG